MLRPSSLAFCAALSLAVWSESVRGEAPAQSTPGPPSDEAHYGRAALEMGAVLAVGVGQYWLSASSNHRDWDFPRLSQRFDEENVRFDNNTHVTNNLLHPLAGGAYYGLARANGLSVGESVL